VLRPYVDTSTLPHCCLRHNSKRTASDSELNGRYAFLFSGFDDATGSQVAIAGSFTADGKGNITEGIEDENGPTGSTLTVPLTGTST